MPGRILNKVHLIYFVLFMTGLVVLKTILHEPTTESGEVKPELSQSPDLDKQNAKSGTEDQNDAPMAAWEVRTNNPHLYQNLVQELPFYSTRLDSRGIIRIYDWVWTGEKWDELLNSFSICLSTQGSLDRIHWLPELVNAWRGPVSLAIFITSSEEWIGLNLLVNHFRKCYPLFRDFVSVHLAMPTQIENWTMDLDELQLDREETESFLKHFNNFSCAESDKVLQGVIKRFQANEDAKLLMENYPQNHMRNIAKKACGTDWTFSTDIDIIPRPDSATLLQDFILTDYVQECQQCAFVIPTFELDVKQTYPESKELMVKFWNNSLARPFHFDVFQKAHGATNYQKWAKTNLKEEPIKVSHRAIRKYMQYYEPFYISPSTIPEFQERFIGYGFTRSSQIQESLAEGWKFQVLTPIFSIHWGLQNRDTLINPGNEKIIRRRQTFFNSRIFKRFIKELELRKKLKRQENYERRHGTTPNFSKY